MKKQYKYIDVVKERIKNEVVHTIKSIENDTEVFNEIVEDLPIHVLDCGVQCVYVFSIVYVMVVLIQYIYKMHAR